LIVTSRIDDNLIGVAIVLEKSMRETSSDHLKGVRILLVEDSWHLGVALKNLLQDWGADVAGPVATSIEAEYLCSKHTPDLALVDYNLRGGELAYGLIDRLNDQGVRIIVTSGHAVLPLASGKTVAILPKPFSEAQLLAALRSVTAQEDRSIRTPSSAHSRSIIPPVS
jgi:DNA-binding response OmpR family regulator